MQTVTQISTDEQQSTPLKLLQKWKQYLQEEDYSPGTVKKYIQAQIIRSVSPSFQESEGQRTHHLSNGEDD